MASGETRDSREASGRPGPAAAVAAALGRFPPPTGWRVLAALALVSLGVLAACGGGPQEAAGTGRP